MQPSRLRTCSILLGGGMALFGAESTSAASDLVTGRDSSVLALDPSSPPPQTYRSEKSGVSVQIGNDPVYDIGIGLGLTASPGSFLVATDLRMPFREEFFVGPVMQLGFSDDDLFLAPSLNFGKSVIVVSHDGPAEVEFSADVGVGLAYLQEDHRKGDDSEWGPLFNLGLGASMPLGDGIRIGTAMRFHLLPTKLLDERFVFSWQVIQFRF